MSRVGYELVHEEGRGYFLHRCKRGRYIRSWGPFDSEKRVREELEFQQSMDREEERDPNR